MRKNTVDISVYSLIVLFVSVLFLLVPETVTASVSGSLSLCASRIIPAVFPFSVISSFFISTGGADVIDRFLGRLHRRLFGLPSGASAFICGLLFGFPLGALTASALYRRGALKRDECEILLCYACCASPTFPVFAVGKEMFGSFQLGATIWAAQGLSAVIIGVTLNALFKKKTIEKNVSTFKYERVRLGSALTSAVTEASRVMLNVCGSVTFFSLLRAVTIHFFSYVCDNIYLKLAIASVFEFASGCAAAGNALADGLVSRDIAAFFAGFAIGFSGLSVLCQTASLFPDESLSLRPFILSRLATGIMTATAAFTAVHFFPESINVSIFPLNSEHSAARFFPSVLIFAIALTALAGEKISTCKKSKNVV